MIAAIIRASSRKPALAILLAIAGTAFGAMSLQDLRRDVFPDLSAPVFNVIVQNAAMGAEELETEIAIPLEAALAGLPDVRRIRSTSQLGSSGAETRSCAPPRGRKIASPHPSGSSVASA